MQILTQILALKLEAEGIRAPAQTSFALPNNCKSEMRFARRANFSKRLGYAGYGERRTHALLIRAEVFESVCAIAFDRLESDLRSVAIAAQMPQHHALEIMTGNFGNQFSGCFIR